MSFVPERDGLGKAHWLYDDEMQMHVSACTHPDCWNGPLTEQAEFEQGKCVYHLVGDERS